MLVIIFFVANVNQLFMALNNLVCADVTDIKTLLILTYAELIEWPHIHRLTNSIATRTHQ